MGDGRRDATWTRRMLGRAAVVSLLVALVVGFLPAPTDRLLVLAGTVVRPAPIVWCLVGIGALLGLVRAFMEPDPPDQRASSPRRILVRVLTVALTVAALLSSAWASLGDLGSSFLVLDPVGPDGCRVVVEQHSFLLLGSGRIHVLQPGEHLTREVGRWLTDDGYRPFDLGTWSLQWDGGHGGLVIRWTEDQRWSPERHDVTCTR